MARMRRSMDECKAALHKGGVSIKQKHPGQRNLKSGQISKIPKPELIDYFGGFPYQTTILGDLDWGRYNLSSETSRLWRLSTMPFPLWLPLRSEKFNPNDSTVPTTFRSEVLWSSNQTNPLQPEMDSVSQKGLYNWQTGEHSSAVFSPAKYKNDEPRISENASNSLKALSKRLPIKLPRPLTWKYASIQVPRCDSCMKIITGSKGTLSFYP